MVVEIVKSFVYLSANMSMSHLVAIFGASHFLTFNHQTIDFGSYFTVFLYYNFVMCMYRLRECDIICSHRWIDEHMSVVVIVFGACPLLFLNTSNIHIVVAIVTSLFVYLM